jgi:hypothetical protein
MDLVEWSKKIEGLAVNFASGRCHSLCHLLGMVLDIKISNGLPSYTTVSTSNLEEQ